MAQSKSPIGAIPTTSPRTSSTDNTLVTPRYDSNDNNTISAHGSPRKPRPLSFASFMGSFRGVASKRHSQMAIPSDTRQVMREPPDIPSAPTGSGPAVTHLATSPVTTIQALPGSKSKVALSRISAENESVKERLRGQRAASPSLHPMPGSFSLDESDASDEHHQTDTIASSDESLASEDELDSNEQYIPITGFAVSSRKRNADFHELFPSVPEDDYLIEDYGCALQRDILIQGRIYISEHHICFHANIFGWITNLPIPLYEITAVEKKRTSFINAIRITTPQANYTFSSFLSRNTTYDVIATVWRFARPDHSLEVGTEDSQDSSSHNVISTNGSSVPITKEEAPSVASEMINKVTHCACSKSGDHFKEIVLETVFPGTPDKIYNLMSAGGFIESFMRIDQKFTDVQISDWSPITEGSKLLTRNVSYIQPLNNSAGPKQTKCEIHDENVFCDFDDHVVVLTTMRTPDVPSGDIFVVKTRTCLMWASTITTRVIVTTQVDWTGRKFIKGPIEKSTIESQKMYHSDLAKAMRMHIQERLSEFIPEKVCDVKIYQYLAVYTFLHLAGCVKDQSLLGRFKDHVDEWRQWDIIQCLTHHQVIRDGLLVLLSETKETHPLCPAHIHDDFDGSKLSDLDAQVIAYKLAAVLDDTDPNVRTHKHIIALKDQEAQSMVDLLNALLEESAIGKDLKNLFADTLVKLCRHSCRFPACLILNDITVDADNQVVTGGYSQVSRGQIQGQPIAIKQVTLYMSRMEVMMKACAREAIIWSRLSHPNLLPFYGIFYLANDRSRISLVSPWIEHGHIGQYLERFPQTDREPLAMDIAQGIEYLHTCLPTIVHGDLKPFNIFVTPSGTACLADFGLAYAKDPQRRTATSTQGPAHGGTYPYEAPELLLNEEPVSFAGDVYAFACVLYEMYSGMQPFHLQTVARVILALTAGERPARYAEVNDAMWGLIERCWHQDPAQRPSASDVVRYLGSFAAVDEQRRQHQWGSFRTKIRSRYSFTDHPLPHFLALDGDAGARTVMQL